MVLLALIAIQGYVTHTIGPSAEPSGDAADTAPLAGAPPLFTAHGKRLVSVGHPAGKRIALTFDDGPSAQWTRGILAYLHGQRVPATFFTIGSQAAQFPDIVRREAAEGFEIGDHTLTHTALSNGPMWTRKLQVDMAESILVCGQVCTGIRPNWRKLSNPTRYSSR